jgi:hypothetical protein
VVDRNVNFASIWSTWVVPLAGQKISGLNGLENKIVKVDADGVVRVSKNGLTSRIPIAPFRWAVDSILSGERLTRIEINDAYPHRYSSGVLLVLEQVPVFEVSGRPTVIRLRPG